MSGIQIPKIGMQATNHNDNLVAKADEIKELKTKFDGLKLTQLRIIVTLNNQSDFDDFIELLSIHKKAFINKIF